MKQKSTKQLSTLMLALTLGSGMASASNNTLNAEAATNVAVYAVNEQDPAVEANFQTLSQQLDDLQAALQKCMDYADALGVASQYAGQFSSYGTQIAGMRQSLNAMYNGGSLTAETTLDGYAALAGSINGLLGGLTGQINGNIGSILNASFQALNQGIGTIIANAEQQVNAMNVAEQFAERIAALRTKQQEANAQVTEQQNAIMAETDLVEKLNKAKAVQEYVNGIYSEIQAEADAIVFDAKVAAGLNAEANEAAYQTLGAQLSQLNTNIENLNKQFNALVPAMGGAWAGQYGQQLAAIGQQYSAMMAWLEQQYAAGRLTENTEIPNYANISGMVGQLSQIFVGTIMGQVQASMQGIYPIINGMNASLGEVESLLAEYGLTEQFAEDVATLTAQKNTITETITNGVTEVSTEADYAEKLNKALALKAQAEELKAEFDAACAVVKEKASRAFDQKKAVNEMVYVKMSNQISDLESYYNDVVDEFNSLKEYLNQGAVGQYSYQFAMISQSINAVKGRLASMYQQIQLTNETVLGELDGIKANIAQLQYSIEMTVMYQVNAIMNQVSLAKGDVNTMVNQLERALNKSGKAEEYAGRLADLKALQEEANEKVNEYIEIVGMGDYATKMATALEAQEYINGVKATVEAEYNAIVNEADIAVGISSTKQETVSNKGQVYDMNGRRVANPTKGLYIINGKKVVIK